MPYCQHCGQELPPGANFCEECGGKIDERTPIHVERTKRTDHWSVRKLFVGRLGRLRFFEGIFVSWLPFLVLVTIWGLINLAVTGLSFSDTGNFIINIINNIVIPFAFALSLAFYLVSYTSIASRRCHDIGQSGWLSLGALIPYVGVIFGLIFLFKRGDQDENRYGPSPKNGGFWSDLFNY